MRGPGWRRQMLRMLLTLGATAYLTLPLLGYFALAGAFSRVQVTVAHSAPIAPINQNAAWLAHKQAFAISRPRFPGDTPPSCGSPCSVYPSAYLLDTSYVRNTLEPAKVGTDAAGKSYTDDNMSKLCGPGAAANALWYWGLASAPGARVTATDSADGVTTTWDATHDRAYIAYLAWLASIPGSAHNGMLDDHNPSAGVTLYGMRDGLNWEAARHDVADFRDYFYTITWWNQSSAAEFHHQVQDDIANAHVPVVAEVSARLLPNWSPKGKTIYHFITIVGYDDVHGIYDYTDTCGASTGCGSLHDGGINSVPQAQLWAAITAIPVNMSAAYDAGDGGYVW
jgi:hypothetical protein